MLKEQVLSKQCFVQSTLRDEDKSSQIPRWFYFKFRNPNIVNGDMWSWCRTPSRGTTFWICLFVCLCLFCFVCCCFDDDFFGGGVCCCCCCCCLFVFVVVAVLFCFNCFILFFGGGVFLFYCCLFVCLFVFDLRSVLAKSAGATLMMNLKELLFCHRQATTLGGVLYLWFR